MPTSLSGLSLIGNRLMTLFACALLKETRRVLDRSETAKHASNWIIIAQVCHHPITDAWFRATMASFASAPTVIAVGDRIPACEMHDGFPGVKGDAAKVMIDELCQGARDRSTRTRARA